MDIADGIMAFESGEMDEEQTLAFFQELVNTGAAWTLQGSYGRTAQALLEAGLINQAEESLPELESDAADIYLYGDEYDLELEIDDRDPNGYLYEGEYQTYDEPQEDWRDDCPNCGLNMYYCGC